MTDLFGSSWAALALLSLLVATGCDDKKDTPAPATKAAASASSALPPIPNTPLSGHIGDQAFTLKKVSIVTAKGFGNAKADLPNCKDAVMQKLEVLKHPTGDPKQMNGTVAIFTADLSKLLQEQK